MDHPQGAPSVYGLFDAVPTPKERIEQLDGHLFGNTVVKEAVAMALYAQDCNTSRKPKPLLICGPSGSGKSALADALRQMDRTIIHVNATTLVSNGIVGLSLSSDLPKRVAQAADEDEQRINRAVVILDEFDKLIIPDTNGAHVYGESTLAEVLTLFEGTQLVNDSYTLDTRRVLFICAGAFHKFYQQTDDPGGWDREAYLARIRESLSVEMQGRLRVVSTDPVSKEFFLAMLEHRWPEFVLDAREFGVPGIALRSSAKDYLASRACAVGTGARGFFDLWESLLAHLVFTGLKRTITVEDVQAAERRWL